MDAICSKRDPAWVATLARFCDRLLRPYHRAIIRGMERVPPGKALYVGNHNAGLYMADLWIMLGAMHRELGIEAIPFVLGHDIALNSPFFGPVLEKLGGVRAHPDNARRVFETGHKLLVYPGGDRESLRPYAERNQIKFAGRSGYIRLALCSDVPIVPVVSAGAHHTFVVLDDLNWLAERWSLAKRLRVKVFPVVLSIPWGLTVGFPPPYVPWPSKILLEVLPPVRFDRSGQEAADDRDYVRTCADHVERLMQAALDRLGRERFALSRLAIRP